MMNPFKVKKGLGRGLSSLIGDSPKSSKKNIVSISSIVRNKFQPRKLFDKNFYYLTKRKNLKEAAKKISVKTGVPVKDVINIIENDNLSQLEDSKDKRDETMEVAHRTKVSSMQSMDENFVQDNPESFGLSPDATPEQVREHLKNNPEDKIATRVYVESFMNEMHWNDYIDAENDFDTVENTGGMIVKPSHYRQCLSQLTGLNEDTESPEGRAKLKKHIRDNIVLDPDSNSIKFKHGDTEVILGHDTYRNAGDGQKLEGKASKALQDCLRGKREAEQKGN